MRFASGWTSGDGPGTEREIEFLYDLAGHAKTRHLFARIAVLEGVAQRASLVLALSDVLQTPGFPRPAFLEFWHDLSGGGGTHALRGSW